MRREKDVINGKVDWTIESEEVWACAIMAVIITIALAVAACNIAYTLSTPPEARLRFDLQARNR